MARNKRKTAEDGTKAQFLADRAAVMERLREELASVTEPKVTSSFVGRWRITWMETWAQDFVDAEVEGFFEFGPNKFGSFQFGYVQGDIEYRDGARNGKRCIEFSWNGQDEMDSARGRGWAMLEGDEIEVVFFIHRGDESAFKAMKEGT
jgi:hypothetical protein